MSVKLAFKAENPVLGYMASEGAGDLLDTNLICKDGQIRCHSVIILHKISACLKDVKGDINIMVPDFTVNELEQMLLYCYTGRCLSSSAPEVIQQLLNVFNLNLSSTEARDACQDFSVCPGGGGGQHDVHGCDGGQQDVHNNPGCWGQQDASDNIQIGSSTEARDACQDFSVCPGGGGGQQDVHGGDGGQQDVHNSAGCWGQQDAIHNIQIGSGGGGQQEESRDGVDGDQNLFQDLTVDLDDTGEVEKDATVSLEEHVEDPADVMTFELLTETNIKLDKASNAEDEYEDDNYSYKWEDYDIDIQVLDINSNLGDEINPVDGKVSVLNVDHVDLTERVSVVVTNTFVCDYCDKQFSSKRSLDRHNQEYHVNPHSFTCDLCNKSFRRKEHLSNHLKTKGCLNNQRPSFECNFCKKNFSSAEKLKSHIHKNCPKRYFCNICLKFFGKAKDFQSHSH